MDNWLILFLVLLAYLDISSKLKRVLNNQNKGNKRDFSLLDSLRGKEIKIETNDDGVFVFNSSDKGILRDFNDVWLILERDTKKGKELIYYRISNINGISEVK